MTRLPLAVVILLIVHASPLTAQAPTLEPGRPVRVVHRVRSTRELTEGRFLSLRADTLRLVDAETAAELAIPAGAIEEVLTVDGKRGNFWAGFGIGLVSGAAVGAAIASQLEFCALDCGPATPFGVIVGAPVGALVGGVIGSRIHSDRWRSIVITPPRVGLSIAL